MTHLVTQSSDNCLGVVLAGGLSSRMKKDKAQLMRNDMNMLDFSTQLLIDSGIKNVVVSGGNQQSNNYIKDLIEQAGPVGGIYSVLSQCNANSYLILPIDLPLMTSKALKQLRLAGELSNKATFFTDHSIPLYLPNNAYLELFFTQVFSKNNMCNIEKKKPKKAGPSVKTLLKQVPHQAIKLQENNFLFNTNTPKEWQQAQKKFRIC